jgi:hypothetical protein
MTWISPIGLLRDQQDAVDLVHLDELDLDALVSGGREVLADVVRADRELAVAAVGEHGQLHALGTAVAEERVDRGPDRAAGVEHVVDEHARHALEWEVERRRPDERLRVPGRLASAHVHVVAVEGDVELAEGDLRAAQLLDALPQPLRKRDAARVDADERDAREVGVPLDDLVCDARQRARDRFGIEKDFRCRGLRRYGALRANLTADSFPASRDRVKGVRCRCETLHGVADGNRDEPLDAVVDLLRELAFRLREAGLVLLVRDEVEGRDVLSSDALEGVGPGERAAL